MYSIVLPDLSVQQVYWSILAIFFVLVILSWWFARGDWLKEEGGITEHPEEQNNETQAHLDE